MHISLTDIKTLSNRTDRIDMKSENRNLTRLLDWRDSFVNNNNVNKHNQHSWKTNQ